MTDSRSLTPLPLLVADPSEPMRKEGDQLAHAGMGRVGSPASYALLNSATDIPASACARASKSRLFLHGGLIDLRACIRDENAVLGRRMIGQADGILAGDDQPGRSLPAPAWLGRIADRLAHLLGFQVQVGGDDLRLARPWRPCRPRFGPGFAGPECMEDRPCDPASRDPSETHSFSKLRRRGGSSGAEQPVGPCAHPLGRRPRPAPCTPTPESRCTPRRPPRLDCRASRSRAPFDSSDQMGQGTPPHPRADRGSGNTLLSPRSTRPIRSGGARRAPPALPERASLLAARLMLWPNARRRSRRDVEPANTAPPRRPDDPPSQREVRRRRGHGSPARRRRRWRSRRMGQRARHSWESSARRVLVKDKPRRTR